MLKALPGKVQPDTASPRYYTIPSYYPVLMSLVHFTALEENIPTRRVGGRWSWSFWQRVWTVVGFTAVLRQLSDRVRFADNGHLTHKTLTRTTETPLQTVSVANWQADDNTVHTR